MLAASDFLTAVTLLASHRRQRGGKGVSCKRADVLRLALDEYQSHAPEVERGLMAAQRLLLRERIFEAQNIPYTTQLIPLGVICSIVGERFEQEAVKAKLARWYWCGVFGQLYGSATEGRFAFDAVQVPVWIGGGEEPRTVRDASFAPVRLLSMQSRLSAAYKGLMALLLQKGSLDFVGGDSIELTTYSELGIDIHHVFPKKHCLGKKYPREKWNSVVNKAPLTAKTNRAIGGSAPSDYLAKIEKSSAMAPERLDEILRTHMIDPVALRNDAFDTFLRHRAAGLLDLIERATGKAVVGRDSEETVNAFGGSLVANAIATMP
ncbi:MAG: hypothetical protein HY720_10265 [Planctomycetes bacterium]|nr:hypothetical protein [Planctomycetota bacterium]